MSGRKSRAMLALVLTLGAALPTAAAAQGHSAIAYSPQAGEWGWARNYHTRIGAAQAARLQCRSAALRGCRVVVQVQGACAALAVGPTGWGAGAGATPARAEAEALGACRTSSRNCTARLGICSP